MVNRATDPEFVDGLVTVNFVVVSVLVKTVVTEMEMPTF